MSDSGILTTRAVPKVWGRRDLPAPFSDLHNGDPAKEPIGEVWFASPPSLNDVLVKYLFTSDKLSVQVHPSDAQAVGDEEGKEECWLILDAQPGAELAIGFCEPITSDAMRKAAQDGSIEELLDWHEVQAGDFFYLPAGTVHAIGAGLSLIEVQQSSDTTFRLYDYGRPRDLHLDRAIAVANGGPHSSEHRAKVSETTETLVHGPHFRLARLVGSPDGTFAEAFSEPVLVLPVTGKVQLSGEAVKPGQCAHADCLERFDFSSDAVSLIVSGTA